MSPPSKSPRGIPKSPAFWGVVLFLFALAWRAIGIGWGLPNDLRNQSLHPDEPIVWMVSQRIEPAKLSFEPGFYQYPTLYLTLNRIATDLVNAYGGKPKSASEADQWKAIGMYHLAGRWLSAMAGAATAWIVFLLLLRVSDLRGAFGGGFFMAIAPGAVVHSRFQTVDALATMLLALSLYWAVRFIVAHQDVDRPPAAKNTWQMTLLAGIFAGLSAGTKYTGILAIAATLLAVGLVKTQRKLLLGMSAVCVAVGAFLMTTPGALLNPQQFAADFRYEALHTSTGHGLVFEGTTTGAIYHLANLGVGVGSLMTLLGIVGVLIPALRREKWAWALGAFFLVYFILIARAEVKFFRYVLPLIPVLAVGFGSLFGEAARLAKEPKWRAVVIACILAAGGFAGGGLATSARWSLFMASEDPRDAVARKLKVPPENFTVGLVSDPWFYTPPIYPDTALPRSVPFEQRDELMRAATSPRVVRYVPPDPNARADWDPRLIDELNPDQIVYSSFEFDDVARLSGRTGLPPEVQVTVDRAAEFGKKLQESYDLQAVYGLGGPKVHDLMYFRPQIWVWKRKTHSNKQ